MFSTSASPRFLSHSSRSRWSPSLAHQLPLLGSLVTHSSNSKSFKAISQRAILGTDMRGSQSELRHTRGIPVSAELGAPKPAGPGALTAAGSALNKAGKVVPLLTRVGGFPSRQVTPRFHFSGFFLGCAAEPCYFLPLPLPRKEPIPKQ